ncbi:hypothetical protein [Oceanobacillus neutriphilus]|uniref:Uncharacterized protein n=1 Tax=Oceanobacillus neutriphilus TaxID=531815 RepID=A0ABQ2NY44_9BACI|nr:hypothetical protein [Oceanobacillus neutriphilus]GGP13448.1 hypothetical protein GCM10011346_33480 [Oceanobacillus neutriphilus]
MTINDVRAALDDLVEHYGFSEDAVIHTIGSYGESRPINGFDEGDDGKLYVIGYGLRPVKEEY